MTREREGVEKGFDIYLENSDTSVGWLVGTAVPDGLGDQAAAPIGSIYQRIGVGELYQKVANVGAASDWVLNGSAALQLGFRAEKVRAVTSENVLPAVRNLTTTPFTDDDGTTMVATDFTVGEFLISNSGATAVLLEVTNVSAPNVTFSTPTTAPVLAEFDTFLTPNYLPDADTQENQALVQVTSAGSIAKVGDVDWDFATGINISGGYTPASGNITSADTVESAIEKLDGNNDAQDTAIGISQGDTNLGSYTGPQTHLTNNSSAKTGIQENANRIFENEGQSSANNITTEVVLDSELVDDYRSVLWHVDLTLASDEARVRSFTIRATHDGTTIADAANSKSDVKSILNLGSGFNKVVSIGFSGAAGTQAMELKISAAVAINARAQRISRVAI